MKNQEQKSVQGILDYIKWRGDLPFSVDPINEIDALIFSQLSYLNFAGIISPEFSKSGITLAQASRDFFNSSDLEKRSNPGLFLNDLLIQMLLEMAKTTRYADMRLCGYRETLDTEAEKQFAAVTIYPGDGTLFVVYRGTDDTLVGWKEDFNMAFITPIPSQIEAVTYLQQAAAKHWGKIRVAGHSKGGNLAIYASTYCGNKTQRKIIEIYNNDGPGFAQDITKTAEYQPIANKVQTFVPQTSIIGMLLEQHGPYKTVKSKEVGIMQHDPFSWELDGPMFDTIENVTNQSIAIDKTIKTWLKTISQEERSLFVDTLYKILTCTNATTLSQLAVDFKKNPLLIVKTLIGIDQETRSMIWQILQQLFKSAKQTIPTMAEFMKIIN